MLTENTFRKIPAGRKQNEQEVWVSEMLLLDASNFGPERREKKRFFFSVTHLPTHIVTILMNAGESLATEEPRISQQDQAFSGKVACNNTVPIHETLGEERQILLNNAWNADR